jgi:membrane protease YdiL (CAAX protease family)
MKNNKRIIYGIIITVVIFVIATFGGSKLPLKIELFPSSFITHTLMLLMSIAVINIFKKNVNYKISLPKFKKILRPILFGLLAPILVNISMGILIKISGGESEAHPLLTKMTSLQVFVFVFIYASIAEEILFRGFLLNILKPLKAKGISILKRKISVPVIISAFTFGLGHLILITTGVGGLFLMRVVIFTTILGLIAGYYQEKYDNNAYAIIVHMSGNLLAIIGSLL